jgi:hypothetical protein
MFDCNIEILSGGKTQRYLPHRDGLPIRNIDALGCWQADENFRNFFIELLAESKFKAFRWETPPITTSSAEKMFEFVLIDAPGLDSPPDFKVFSNYFIGAEKNESVVTFPNLGKDAVLVVPSASQASAEYAHLGAFVRGAPQHQKHQLWRVVGDVMKANLNPKPIWLSTAGMGIAWLHVRLDSRPKYYSHAPYRMGT